MNKLTIGVLEEGDYIQVCNPFRSIDSFYVVSNVEGNEAFTKFRKFNTKIYLLNRIYEYGKRQSAIYNNDYYGYKQDDLPAELIMILSGNQIGENNK